ncbi:MAG: alpha/beta hydrolase [Desulfovibrionaceae bacterium]
MPLRLIWSHGKDAVPWGAKSQALAQRARTFGLELEAPDYTSTQDPDRRVEMLLDLLAGATGPVLLAGSSMGGYVSAATALRRPVAGLFLLAPALYLEGYAVQDFSALSCPVAAIHGWRDDVVPVEHSIRFARRLGARLLLLEAGHRMTEQAETVADAYARFLAERLDEQQDNKG